MPNKDIVLVEDTEKRNALTEKLLANARKSLTEISQITGLDTVDLAERYARLFEDRGWMTERQEERLLLIELGDLIADAKSRLKDAEMRDYASVARVVLQSMTLMANRFDARKKLVDEDIMKITASNARLFGSAFDIALKHVTDGIIGLYPDLEHSIVDGLVAEGLKKAKKRLEQETL